MTGLYRAFEETDSSLMEINPFITCTDGRLFALDAKMTFDDNAMFRHEDLRELRDVDGGRSAGSRGVEVQFELHQARWKRGLHGERRRTGHGDDGHH